MPRERASSRAGASGRSEQQSTRSISRSPRSISWRMAWKLEPRPEAKTATLRRSEAIEDSEKSERLKPPRPAPGYRDGHSMKLPPVARAHQTGSYSSPENDRRRARAPRADRGAPDSPQKPDPS